MRLLRRGAGWASASILGSAYMLGLVACAGQATDEQVASVHGDLTAAEVNEAALGSEGSCDALLGRLQGLLLAQVNERAEQARSSGAIYYGGGVFIDDVAPVPDFSGSVAAPASEGVSIAPSGFSRTTSQVPGVEDGDFVKADGDRIYLLHGSTLFVLNAWPANATLVLASIPIEGEAAELHVQDGTVAVLSRVYGPLPGTADSLSPYYYYYPTFSKLTVIDAAGDAPEVVREAFVEGESYSSRRTGSVVHAVVQQYSKAQLDYPSVAYTDIFGNPRSQTEIDLQVDLWALLATESIEDSSIEDYLPTAYERVGGELVQQPLDCEQFLLTSGSLTQAGSTSIVSLDLDAPTGPLGRLSLLGYADSVFVDADSIVLSQADYGDYASPVPTQQANLHLFALDGTSSSYTASGRVEGYINGTLALDEVGGVVRVATSQDTYETISDGGVETVNYVGYTSRVVTLQAEGDVLSELGRSLDLGPPQSLSSARFVGSRAYLTTSGVENQLTVVDLADPEAPRLRGSTPIQSYGSVLVPLAGNRLLSVGDFYDPVNFSQSLTLQLVDASDADDPFVSHDYSYPTNTYSDASYDARAVSLHPSAGIFALPVQNNIGVSTLDVFELSDDDGFTRLGGVVPPEVELGFVDCLVLFGYPTDPASIEQLEEDPAFVDSIRLQCGQYYQSVARRGLFRGEYVYTVASQSVSAHSLDGLDEPALSQVELPAPIYSSSPGIPVPLAAPVIIDEGVAGAGGGSFE
jgi:inhibitor of cysteine peptidase